MLPKFYGDSLDWRNYEVRAMRLDPMHRANQADLVQTRWFDYFDMHPSKATYLFAHTYKEFTRIFCESFIDIRTAEDARAFAPDDIFFSRDLTSMWLARQAADAHGIPYEFVLQHSKERCLSRHFQVFARPNQLYGEEFEIDLLADWSGALSRSLRFSRRPEFKAKNFKRTKAQVKHLDFLLAQVKNRHSAKENLLGRLFSEGVLSPELVTNHFNESVVGKAMDVALKLSAQS